MITKILKNIKLNSINGINRASRLSYSSLTYDSRSTIFAVASGKGKCGVSVIRVSGPKAFDCISGLTQKPISKFPPNKLTYSPIYDPSTNSLIDRGMLVKFQEPNSFTGENVVELHVHGSVAIVKKLLEVLNGFEFFRSAESGEFTKRSFFNGKLDLTQVEGLADLLEAETEVQRKLALKQSEGELGQLYQRWRYGIIDILSQLEAWIDFSEDEELDPTLLKTCHNLANELISDLKSHLEDGRKGEILREGIKLAILGPPNAGKSSLLNWLVKREAAIVSPIAGTTRDLVEVRVEIGGFPVIIVDTAGLRDSEDIIEVEGMKRALKQAKEADFNLLVLDGTKLNSTDKDEYIRSLYSKFSLSEYKKNTIILYNKSDLYEGANLIESELEKIPNFKVSCETQEGLNEVLGHLKKKFDIEYDNVLGSDSLVITQTRHRLLINRAVEKLEHFIELLPIDPVLSVEDLRGATMEIGKLTGEITLDHILDQLFKSFCIGK